MEEVEVLVEGGKASPGPPLGPALGPLGVNVGEIVKKINEVTKEFHGMKVPVKILIDPATKDFELKVGTPPASALIMKKAGIEKGSGDENPVGNITIEDVIVVAKMKKNDLLGKDLKAKVKEIIGTCISMGVTVEGLKGKEIIKKIEKGEYKFKE